MPSLKELVTAEYKSIKSAESERLIEESLKGLTSEPKPELIQVSGIPGAGKSTYCAAHQRQNFLFLSFDKIMLSLSGYQQELQQNGSISAFEKYEMPARIIGYELLRRAINKKINIMFEHSGANPTHLELFKNIPAKGYKPKIVFIMCDIALALKRAEVRAKETKRYVPEHLILERAEKMKEYMALYQKEVKNIAVFDGGNNFSPLNKI